MTFKRTLTILGIPIATMAMAANTLQVPEPSVFQLPALQAQAVQLQKQMFVLAAAKKFEEAEQTAAAIAKLTPRNPAAHYNLGCIRAIANMPDAAFGSLNDAVRLGFRNPDHIRQDKDLVSLRSDSRFETLLEDAAKPFEPEIPNQFAPADIENGVAIVTEKNTRWLSARNTLIAEFNESSASKDGPPPVVIGESPADKAVRKWFEEGTAAGHTDILYDNRDRDHSNLDYKRFPQLTRVEYGETAKRMQVDWGVQIHLAFNRPTFGNSSTAQVGSPYWRSNPRMFMTSDAAAKLIYNQYVNNQMYFYPEHADYDPKHGDVYPANVPYCIISQGSSGSDRVFMDAVALTLAAFRPDVRDLLVKRGMLMPTVQAIFRRCNKPVIADEDYLTGRAHPIVFQGANVDPLRMVTMAHNIQKESVPPVVQIQVTKEQLGLSGRDYIHNRPGEKLFDTPMAIARLYRSAAKKRRMVIDASKSRDANNLPLTYKWVVLQGDPKLVDINPLGTGETAEIAFTWHPQAEISPVSNLKSSRVDVGVFAHNGTWYSAPAFVTSFSFANEKREYDGNRITSIDYAHPDYKSRYVDPLIDLPKNWRDDYKFDDDGKLAGWTRTMPDKSTQDFTRDGAMITKRDRLGRPIEASIVTYLARPGGKQPPTLAPLETVRVVEYTYASDTDTRGKAVLREPDVKETPDGS